MVSEVILSVACYTVVNAAGWTPYTAALTCGIDTVWDVVPEVALFADSALVDGQAYSAVYDSA